MNDELKTTQYTNFNNNSHMDGEEDLQEISILAL
jgi:hypothetical protein